MMSISRSSTSRIPTRCIRASGSGALISSARWRATALNFDRLSPLAREAARAAGLGAVCRNPFQSIIVRAVEMLYACDEALRIIEDYREPDRPVVPVEPRAGDGYGGTEAPRGMLYHRYRLDDDGIDPRREDRSADLAEPEEHRGRSAEFCRRLARPARRRAAAHRCEQAIRNYDPCISCATHFLDLRIDRG